MNFVLEGRNNKIDLPLWVKFTEDSKGNAILQAKRTKEASGWEEVRLYQIEQITIE